VLEVISAIKGKEKKARKKKGKQPRKARSERIVRSLKQSVKTALDSMAHFWYPYLKNYRNR
jgi:hypothetical protein